MPSGGAHTLHSFHKPCCSLLSCVPRIHRLHQVPETPHDLCHNGERYRVPWDRVTLGCREGCGRRWVCMKKVALACSLKDGWEGV